MEAREVDMEVQCGSLIKTWRKKSHLSYKDLSMRSGVSAATLSRWEAGRTQPRMAELEAVLSALQVSAMERQQALALMEAPRAIQKLRETAGAGPPVSGDLLRTMRLRRGWTQQETARRAGILQGTLARWESSQDWPSSERLHTLCYVLQAHTEELLALTQGILTAAGSSPIPDTALDRDTLQRRVTQYLFYSPIADLEFLALEAQLWHLSRRHEAAQIQLSYTYGRHARYLAEHQRFEEAASFVARFQQMANSGYRDDTGWADAILAASRIAGAGGRSLHLNRAVNLLYTSAARSPIVQNKAYQAWIASEIALYLAKLGHTETALVQSRCAIQVTDGLDSIEAWYRRGDYAKVLLQLGRHQEALDECSACLVIAGGMPERIPFLFTGVRALLGGRQFTAAADWLQEIDSIIDAYPKAIHYRALADTLRQRLDE